MPSSDLLAEAERQLTICNACRYCEGYCAVFPAMEQRRTFTGEDLIYMANLCHDCRACYHACQYAPPHPFGVNIPEVLSAIRVETYRDYAAPRLLSRLFSGNTLLVGLVVALSIVLVFGSVLVIQGRDVLFEANTEKGAFYDVVPYMAMVLPAMALSAYWLVVLLAGGVRFWRSTRGSLTQMIDAGALLGATKDAFGLEYLKGGGEGCSYPDERFSYARRWYHHALVWGLLLDLASTTVAAIYHNFLGKDAPYPYLSLPVVLGVAGGVLILIGGGGLLWLKARADSRPAHEPMLNLDVAFLALLLLTSASGLLLLVLRQSSIMGALLTVHLGIIAALYLTLPYGKFAHIVYRYAALIRYRIEQSQPHAG